MWLGNFAARMNRLIFLAHSRRWAYSPLARWNASMQLVYFCNAKGQREFEFTLAFVASHEVCRRMAVFAIQPAGSRTRPASREACRRAAVTLHPSRMSSERPRALWRGVGCRGTTPAREPRGLSPSGGKTPANMHVSRAPCAPTARSPGSRGTAPCRCCRGRRNGRFRWRGGLRRCRLK